MRRVFILLLMLYSAAAGASEYQCRYDGNQREMNACAVQDFKEADAALNDAYRKRLARLDSIGQELLRIEQRAWIKRRDARCASAKKGQGTNVTIDYLSCMAVTTEIRTLQLSR